jgi:hypothetical protein
MRNLRPALLLLATPLLLVACPAPGGPKLAQLHLACGGTELTGATEPPPTGMACPPGSQVSFNYDNEGSYPFVTVFAVTRDNIVFFFPADDSGQSVSINPTGKGVALPGTFTLPPKTRDVMALFTKEPLKAKDVAQHTRDVTLAQLPGTEIRVRLSREVGPLE